MCYLQNTSEVSLGALALRMAISEFETDYDVEKYSPTNYLDWIKAPIELHQGTGDEAVWLGRISWLRSLKNEKSMWPTIHIRVLITASLTTLGQRQLREVRCFFTSILRSEKSV